MNEHEDDFLAGFDEDLPSSNENEGHADKPHMPVVEDDMILSDDDLETLGVQNDTNSSHIDEDEEIASQYGLTVDEYRQALREQQEQAADLEFLEDLISNGVSEDKAFEMLNTHKQNQLYEAEAVQQMQNEITDFIEHFSKETGREFDFNSKADNKMLQEIFKQSREQGSNMKRAYQKSNRAKDDMFLSGFDSYTY